MGTYNWTQAVISNVYTLGHPPLWFTYTGTPTQAISIASPVGDGDILVRSEFAAAMMMASINDEIVVDPIQLWAMTTLFVGEVYPAGVGGFPDPHQHGTVSGVISAAATARALTWDPANFNRGVCAWDTGGYVTSQGRRGPAKYGGGHPELRIGMYTTNCFDLAEIGVANTTETYAVRALWYTP